MFLTIQLIGRTLISCACPVALVFAMSSFRCKRKTAWIWYGGIILLATVVCAALLFTAGLERMRQVYFIVLLVPALAFLLLNTKDKPSQLLFNFFTAVNAFYLTSILSHFALGGKEEPIWGDILIRLVIFAAILFVFIRYLREPYRFIAVHMKKDWRVIAVLPFLFFALVMFLGMYPHTRSDNLLGVVFLYVILCLVYYVIYQVFRNTYTLLKVQDDNNTLKTQVLALERQTEAIRRSEEQVRIYRHDMRHYIGDVAALLREDNVGEALRVLGDFDERNKRTELPRYCKNATVNAILTLYFGQAMDAGIKVEADCSVPETLPVESAELAMVLANAVENAIHACDKLPKGTQKRISVRVMAVPHLVLEVANTYDGQVQLDEQGLPVSKEEGHGIGTKSILAFVDKYDGVLSYKPDDTMFRLRLMVSNP